MLFVDLFTKSALLTGIVGMISFSSADAAITITGDASSSFVIEFTEDIEYSINGAGDVGFLVFDGLVTTADAAADFSPANPSAFVYSLNGAPDATVPSLSFVDNFVGNVADVEATDGLLNFNNIGVVNGDVVTVKAGSYTITANGDVNPEVIQTFTGDTF